MSKKKNKLTIQEAIYEIMNMKKYNYTLAPDEVFDMAIEALAKRIPVDPYEGCGHTVDRKMNFCPICGQAIYWEKENMK